MHTNSSSDSENSGSDTERDVYVTQSENTSRKRTAAETTPPSVTVVEAVAAATDVDVDELPLLYEVVDPDALDALFGPKYAGKSRASRQVQFMFADCEVTVTADGEVTVRGPFLSSSSSINDSG